MSKETQMLHEHRVHNSYDLMEKGEHILTYVNSSYGPTQGWHVERYGYNLAGADAYFQDKFKGTKAFALHSYPGTTAQAKQASLDDAIAYCEEKRKIEGPWVKDAFGNYRPLAELVQGYVRRNIEVPMKFQKKLKVPQHSAEESQLT